jgi:group I intron endonuclease
MLVTSEDKKNLKNTGIYKITNPENGNFYIGSAAVSLSKRFSDHKRLLNLNKNPCVYLQRAYNKSDKKTFIFTILEHCEKEDCISREQYYIDTYSPKYNLCKYAGSSRGLIRTETHIKNQFEATRAFSDDEVIQMFNLYNSGVKCVTIAKILNCKPNNVSSIINKSHKYILVKDKYNLKIENKITRYKGNYLVTAPNGEVTIVSNLKLFALENGLESSNLNRCSNNIIKKSKGYKVEKID